MGSKIGLGKEDSIMRVSVSPNHTIFRMSDGYATSMMQHKRKRNRSPLDDVLSRPEGCGMLLSKIRGAGAGLSIRLEVAAVSAGAGAAMFVLSTGAPGFTCL